MRALWAVYGFLRKLGAPLRRARRLNKPYSTQLLWVLDAAADGVSWVCWHVSGEARASASRMKKLEALLEKARGE